MPDIERPRLARPGEVVGAVTPRGSAAAGLPVGIPVGIPVLAGTIDPPLRETLHMLAAHNQ